MVLVSITKNKGVSCQSLSLINNVYKKNVINLRTKNKKIINSLETLRPLRDSSHIRIWEQGNGLWWLFGTSLSISALLGEDAA